MRPEIRRTGHERVALHRRYFPIPAPEAARSPWLVDGLYAGEPITCTRNLRRFLPILCHFGAMIAVFGVYRVEGRAFGMLSTIALASLPIHYMLPLRHKQSFFIAASIAGLFGVFGAGTASAVLGLAAFFLVAVRLPIDWHARVGIVAILGTACAFARVGRLAPGIPETVWPVLASMFMFRIIILLYELKHESRPESLGNVIGYFFLLPNYAFMHFPVIDYRGLQRSYFAVDVHVAQQRGLRMIFRGTIQLLIYRLIYHDILISPNEVVNFASLILFLFSNYLLYLHVSGQFHLACGMMHLFGYSLPETHNRYFLASSFTDYWRRINIYWKDFMVRVVFNPVAFRLKHRPEWFVLASATTAVFLTTWILHAYQSFWLRGDWVFSIPDALFWGVLGVLVLINVQADAKTPRSSAKVKTGIRFLALNAFRTLATFSTIAVLWSLWSSPTLSAWLAMMSRGLTA